MGIPDVIDNIVTPHGHRQGVSFGWLTTIWLSYILSEADHRMNRVEPWAASRLESLRVLTPGEVTAKDFTDDRLADSLRLLSDDAVWEQTERQLSRRLVRVYDLNSDMARLDSTTAPAYHDPDMSTLFGFGHSKDHRPDLPQLKVMLGTLDPLGIPVATLVVPGETADDGLYLPLAAQMRQTLGPGYLYVGDNKMSACATRAALVAAGDLYLTALPRTGHVPQLLPELLAPVWTGTQTLTRIYKRQPYNEASEETNKRPLQALAYETERTQEAKVEGERRTWQERLLVVYSPQMAKRARRGLEKRLQTATDALRSLTPPRGPGRTQWQDLDALETKVTAILKRHRVEGLLSVDYHLEVERLAVRAYGDRPARTEERYRYLVSVRRETPAILQVRRLLGWRLYVTNAPPDRLSLTKAIHTYRGAPTIERGFRRLKGHPLGLPPLYVQREDHAQGLVRLLTLGLRVLTVVEHVVRRGLAAADERLSGLYPANPTRETARPTAERLLEAFNELTLTVVRLPDQVICHLTPLSDLQRRILRLLQLPGSLYEDIVVAVRQNSIIAQDLSEP
jgi:transposase